jgi:hypothetical protein
MKKKVRKLYGDDRVRGIWPSRQGLHNVIT